MDGGRGAGGGACTWAQPARYSYKVCIRGRHRCHHRCPGATAGRDAFHGRPGGFQNLAPTIVGAGGAPRVAKRLELLCDLVPGTAPQDRQISRLFSLENPTRIKASLPIGLELVGAVAHQASCYHEVAAPSCSNRTWAYSASHSRAATSTIASSTGLRSLGEREITLSISLIAV
jgi:hypothetical protein